MNLRSRRRADWIGFGAFVVLACATVSKMSAAGLMLIPTIAFDLFVAMSFLIREPARTTAPTLRARVSAHGGTFLLLVFIQVAQHEFPHWLTPSSSEPSRAVGVLLWLNGWVWSGFSLWYLRHAFSIEPQARRLITSGPYGVARHPVYTGYFVQYAGMWLLFPTAPFAAALVVWVFLTADRMRHEERVLATAFPEYVDYRRHVGALGTVRLHVPRPWNDESRLHSGGAKYPPRLRT